MTDDATALHLSNHHRATLSSLLRYSTGHDIEGPDVLALLDAMGTSTRATTASTWL